MRVSASRARSSRPTRDRLLGLALQLVGLRGQLVDLELHPLARRGDVGDPAAYLGQQVELTLVAVVEGLARVLGLVERLVRLGPEDQADPLPHAHGARLWVGVKVAAPTVG